MMVQPDRELEREVGVNIKESFREILRNRKTTRKFSNRTLPKEPLDAILFAAFGKTHSYKNISMRTAPSAGATYPLDIYLAIEDVTGMGDGIYKYDTTAEMMKLIRPGGFFNDLKKAALDQDFISKANINLLMVYVPERIVPEYGKDSLKYAAMECGHIGQNVLLMAAALELGSVPVGAFEADKMGAILGIKKPEEVLYIISIGQIAKNTRSRA